MAARSRVSLLAFALALLPSRGARAEASESFRFSWVRGEGAGTCPDGRALATRVAERLGRNPFAETAGQSIEGSVVRRDERFHAELTVRDDAGVARGTRELSAGGGDCVELADAVVLAVSLTIDPNAALGAPPATALPPVSPPPPDVAAPVETPAVERCPVVSCPPVEPCRPAPCPPQGPTSHTALVARGEAAAGVLPGVATGVAVVGELGSRRVRASLGMHYFPEAATEDGRYAFGLTSASAGVVFAWQVRGGLELSALAELDVGAVHAVVYELEPVEPGDQPWIAVAVGPRLGFLAFSPARLELGVRLIVPFIRPSFEVRGASDPVFQASGVGGLAYVGVGLGTP